MISPGLGLIDGAFVICTALDAAGLTAILCGGSAATYYAPDAYMSADNDFVLNVSAPRKDITAALAPLGFREEGRIYVHDLVEWTVDFPAGPLAVGREIVTSWATVRRGGQLLHILSATDSVRDRFMHYFAWNDYSGLVQAVAVARAQRADVDLAAFRAWAERELRETPIYERKRVNAFFKALRASER